MGNERSDRDASQHDVSEAPSLPRAAAGVEARQHYWSWLETPALKDSPRSDTSTVGEHFKPYSSDSVPWYSESLG